MSKCPQMLAFKLLTKPLLLAYPFVKVLASSREDPTLLHVNNTDTDQSAHLLSPISALIVHYFRKHMGLFQTKPAFGAYDQARPKQVSTATETSQNIETSLVAS